MRARGGGEKERACIKEFEGAAHNKLESFNSATEDFQKAYPKLAEDIFGLEVDSDRQSISS